MKRRISLKDWHLNGLEYTYRDWMRKLRQEYRNLRVDAQRNGNQKDACYYDHSAIAHKLQLCNALRRGHTGYKIRGLKRNG